MDFDQDIIKYLRWASELADQGRGFVSPNPVVGSVLVRDGEVIAEDWHRQVGEGHAERNLLERFSGEVRPDDTLYITLEPCCHQGKTPPCTEAILPKGIKRVVVGLRDPNPEVSGKGIQILRDAGVEVIVFEDGTHESAEAQELLDQLRWQNRFFFHWVQQRRPWVTLKMAQTLDGRVVPERGKQVWLTGEKARQHVHLQRAQYDAILVGAGTVIADDPRLTARDIQDQPLPHQPNVVVLDAAFSVPPEKAVLRPGTILFCGRGFKKRSERRQQLEEKGVQILEADMDDRGYLHLGQVMDELAARAVTSVFVEGGAAVWSSCLREGLAQELMVYIAPKFLGQGVSSFEDLGFSDALSVHLRDVQFFDDDVLWWGTIGKRVEG